jgi:hypothetical protein
VDGGKLPLTAAPGNVIEARIETAKELHVGRWRCVMSLKSGYFRETVRMDRESVTENRSKSGVAREQGEYPLTPYVQNHT